MVNRSNAVVASVLFVAISLISSMCLASTILAPPDKYHVGTLVFYSATEEPSHLIQFPGSPFDCTDTYSSEWCLWTTCDTVSSSTYTCENIPLVYTCLAFQTNTSDVITKVLNVDSDGCK